MKTGIEHIFEQFNRMADLTRGWLNKPHELNLYAAINTINYLDGLAFASTMAHKECESDADLAAAMCDDAKFLRDWYYQIRLAEEAETP